MFRPDGAIAAEPLQEYVEPLIAFSPIGVKRDPQTRRDTVVVATSGAFGQPRETNFSRLHIRRQQLAFGHQASNREDQLVVMLPGRLR